MGNLNISGVVKACPQNGTTKLCCAQHEIAFKTPIYFMTQFIIPDCHSLSGRYLKSLMHKNGKYHPLDMVTKNEQYMSMD